MNKQTNISNIIHTLNNGQMIYFSIMHATIITQPTLVAIVSSATWVTESPHFINVHYSTYRHTLGFRKIITQDGLVAWVETHALGLDDMRDMFGYLVEL